MTADGTGSVATGQRLVSTLLLASTIALLLVGVVLLTRVSHNRAFQVDEVEHIHAAYNMRDGRLLYEDFWQGHNPLLYLLLAPWVDPAEPVDSFHAARRVPWLMLLLTLALSGYCALRLGGRLAGLLTVGLAVFHTTLVERGMEVRPDGPLALCTALALALELSPRGSRLTRRCLQGVALSAGFLFTQKAVFVCFAFGCLWLWTAIRERRPREVVLPFISWLAPVGIALAIMAVLGNLPEYVQYNFTDALQAAAGAEHRQTFSPSHFVFKEGVRNIVFSLLALVGLAGGLWRAARPGGDDDDREMLFPTLLAYFLLATLWANPFPWPYVHVTVLPTLSVVIGVVVARALADVGRSRHPAFQLALGLLLIAAGASTSVPRLLIKGHPESDQNLQAFQQQTLEEVRRISQPDDAFFDLVGLYFRPDGYRAYALSGDLLRWYRLGGFPPMVEALRQQQTVGVILNYRTGSLSPTEKQFFFSHYTHHWGNIYLLGRGLSEMPVARDVEFEVLKTKEFELLGDVDLWVDGAPFRRGVLAAGMHRLRIERAAGEARLVMATPRPRLPAQPSKPLFINFD